MIISVVRFMLSKSSFVGGWLQLPEIENHPDQTHCSHRTGSQNIEVQGCSAAPQGYPYSRLLPSLCSVALSIRCASHRGHHVLEEGCIFALPPTFPTGREKSKGGRERWQGEKKEEEKERKREKNRKEETVVCSPVVKLTRNLQ